MEYPGYSVYKSTDISEEIIVKDSEAVMNYLLNKCHVPVNRIIIMGRSLGSGPAIRIANKFEVGCLLLISPFTSIKEVASHHYGIFGSLLIKNRFENQENIKGVKCPVLMIHGKEDDVVPERHSETLKGNLRSLRKMQNKMHTYKNCRHDS